MRPLPHKGLSLALLIFIYLQKFSLLVANISPLKKFFLSPAPVFPHFSESLFAPLIFFFSDGMWEGKGLRACTSQRKNYPEILSRKVQKNIDRSIQHFASPKRNKRRKRKEKYPPILFSVFSTFFCWGDIGPRHEKKGKKSLFPHFLIKLFSSGKGKKRREMVWRREEKEPNGKGIIIFVFICIKNQLWDWRKRRERRVLTLPPPSSSSSFYFFFWKKRERVIGTPHAENGKRKSFFFVFLVAFAQSVVCLLLSLLAKTITLQKAIIREDTKHFQLKPSLSP